MNSKLKTQNLKLKLNRFSFVWNRLDRHMHEVVRGASVAFLLKVLGTGLAFGFNVLLARTLGADGAGIYFLALSVTSIATVFGRLGLDNALLRFVASNAEANDWAAVKGVYGKGVRLALAASSVSAVAVLISAPWFADGLFSKPDLTTPIRWMSLSIVPLVMVFLYAVMLRGLKRIKEAMLVQVIAIPLLSLSGLAFLGSYYGVNGAVWAYCFAGVAAAVGGSFIWRTATHRNFSGIEGTFPAKKLFGSSTPLFWMSLLSMVVLWTSTFMLGVWGTSSDVGIFGIANRTAMLTSFVLFAVNSIAAPKFAALYHKGDLKALASTARNSAKLMILFVSPIILLFIIMPGQIMGIFGSGFEAGSMVLVILAVGQFVNVATGSVGALLVMSGHERQMRNVMAVTAILCVSLNAALIPGFGAMGAALATAICLAFQNLMASFYVFKYIKIVVIPVPWLKTGLTS